MDLDERIKPALGALTGRTLNAQEFQRLLYEYFEEKGVLMDLRAHLRTQMISVLKESTLGKVLVKRTNEISPKTQAINLLIAEYLFYGNYHYSLSVFTSEVHLANVAGSLFKQEKEFGDKLFKFSDGDLTDILGALGFNLFNSKWKELSAEYKKNHCSLIQSILQGISKENAKFGKLMLSENKLEVENAEQLMEVFKGLNIDLEVRLNVLEKIHFVVNNEVEVLRKNNREELEREKKRMALEFLSKLDKYKRKMMKMDLRFKEEKRHLESHLLETKKSLLQNDQTLQEKQKVIDELKENIQKLEKQLRVQENSLQIKEQKLLFRQEYLQNKEEKLDKCLEDFLHLKQQKIPFENKDNLENLKKVPSVEDIVCKEKLKSENLELKKSSETLQEEIASLKNENLKYHEKVTELVTKTNKLLTKLEENQQQTKESSLLLKKDWIEEEEFPKFNFKKIHWKNPSEKAAILKNSSSSEDLDYLEDTRTDLLLKESKSRLELLENESKEIDLHFKTLATENTKNTNETTKSLLQSFHSNVALLKDSISKIFFDSSKQENNNHLISCAENVEKKDTKVPKVEATDNIHLDEEVEDQIDKMFCSLKRKQDINNDFSQEEEEEDGNIDLMEKYEECSIFSSEFLNLNGETISTIEFSSIDEEKYQ